MSYLGIIGDVVETVETSSSVGLFSFEWIIPNFLTLAGGGADRYRSPDIYACGEEWFFVINPKGWYQISPSEWVHLYLFREVEAPTKTFKVMVGIRGPEGVENRRERLREFSANDRACFWNRFCSRLKLKEQASRLMWGDMLIISLEMKSVVPSIPRGIEKVVEDIGKLLVSGDDCDITVQVGDVQFQVHKVILSARCPVLSAMFKHETEEKATNRITISDCEPEVFGDFLHYLYKGSAQHLSEKNVFGLYRIGDKYLADDLKWQCLQFIRDTLSVQTFCDAVQLALTHGESRLLEQAMDFAVRNIRSIIRTIEWQNFIHVHPTEANEILIKALGPPS